MNSYFSSFEEMSAWAQLVISPEINDTEILEVFAEFDEWSEEGYEDEIETVFKNRLKTLKGQISKGDLKEINISAEIEIESLEDNNLPVRWYWKLFAKS